MELLHRRLGHTSQWGMERLVREQLVRGLEAGIQGDLEMCKGCKMGKSSEQKHPQKSQEHRAQEQLELYSDQPIFRRPQKLGLVELEFVEG